MKSAISLIPSKYRWPAYALGALVLVGLVGRLFADVPQTELYEVESASLNTTEEAEPLPIADRYAACQQSLNASLLALQQEQAAVAAVVTTGRSQDWRAWARQKSVETGEGELQLLRGAFAALTQRINGMTITQVATAAGESVPMPSMTINGDVGNWRDLEGARADVAMAIAASLGQVSYESADTSGLNSAAMAFLDSSACLIGMEILTDVE